MTFKVTTSVVDEPFIQWMSHARSEFMVMVQTMLNVAHVVEMHSRKYVPIETGRLEGILNDEDGFQFSLIESSSEFIEVQVGYDAVDPESGFHYAKYQHDEYLRHLDRDIGSMDTSSRFEARYLVKGIIDADKQSFEMIEKDYLSLFKGV